MTLLRLLFLILLPVCGPVYAQEPLLRHYTLADGLPSNIVYDVYQDSKGFIWFCTDQGISRFDGNAFRSYSIKDGLPDTEIFRIREDGQHRYWLICFNNKACYLKNGKVYHAGNDALCRKIDAAGIQYDELLHLRSGYYGLVGKRIAELRPAGITIRTLSGNEYQARVYYFRKGHNEYLVKRTYLHHLNSGRRFTISKASLEECFYDGAFLFLCESEAGRFFLKQWEISETGIKLLHKAEAPSCIHQISSWQPGQLVCCTQKGMFVYSISSGRFSRNEFFLQDLQFNRILTDKDGNCWASTLGNGVYFKPRNNATVIDRHSGLPANNIFSLKLTTSGGLIAGDNTGNVTLIDRHHTRRLFAERKGFVNRIRFIEELDPHRLIFGCDMGLFTLDQHNGQSRLLYSHTFKAGLRSGDQFYAGFTGGLLVSNLKTGAVTHLAQQRVTAMAMDKQGILWVGGTNGLSLYKEGQLKPYRFNHLLRQSRITCITRNAQGHIFAGTSNSGLFLIKGQEQVPVQLHLNNSEDRICCKKLFTAKDNQVWLCTEDGLYRLVPDLKGDYMALPVLLPGTVTGKEINDFMETEGRLYLATTEGIVVYNSRDTTIEKPPALYIETVNDNPLPAGRSAVLAFPYKKRNIQISYTGVYFAGKAGVAYKYLLQGGTEDTVYTAARTINFDALSPGAYTLLLWVRSAHSAWSLKPVSVSFRIQPPWWRRPGFLLAAGLLLSAIVFWAYRARLRYVSEKASAAAHTQQQLAELEMKAIKAQINPHFIFNALNAIQSYYSQHSEREANHYMTAFARFIRLTLENSQSHWLPLNEEIAMLRTYIELEQMRFRQLFDYRIDTGPGVRPETIQIPAMLLQPYVENAINHGLRLLQKRKGLLSIRFMLQEKVLICLVEDNGIGISNAVKVRKLGHNSFGMKMNSQRIDAMNRMYNLSIKVTIGQPQRSSVYPEGTLVTLYIPLNNKHYDVANPDYR